MDDRKKEGTTYTVSPGQVSTSSKKGRNALVVQRLLTYVSHAWSSESVTSEWKQIKRAIYPCLYIKNGIPLTCAAKLQRQLLRYITEFAPRTFDSIDLSDNVPVPHQKKTEWRSETETPDRELWQGRPRFLNC